MAEEVKKRGRPKKKIETRGGAREGAGRKPTDGGPRVPMTIKVKPETKAMFNALRERGLNPVSVMEDAIKNISALLGIKI